MRRVVLVGPRPPPSGGVATHIGDLAEALAAHGVRVQAIDPRRRGPDGSDGRPRLIAQLLLARARGDLVHVHINGHSARSWLLAALGATARPSLLTVHSGLAPAFLRERPRLVRAIARCYSHVVAVNTEIAGTLALLGVAPSRIVVCPAFSTVAGQLRLAPPGLRALRRKHSLLVACALAPGREYGADVLLDGIVRLRALRADAACVVYGPGTRDPALARDVRARGLDGAVHLFGEVSRARALAIVTACDVFVRPTRADGDALSVREALELGRPVVASDVGHRPPEATLFPVGDAARMVETIFHAVGKSSGQPVPSEDCVTALLSLYARLGAVA
jgi:glycosyltransferase involved in cell wall biosynthesis